eukprot:762961-Hanusia_phi.AAC.8
MLREKELVPPSGPVLVPSLLLLNKYSPGSVESDESDSAMDPTLLDAVAQSSLRGKPACDAIC